MLSFVKTEEVLGAFFCASRAFRAASATDSFCACGGAVDGFAAVWLGDCVCEADCDCDWADCEVPCPAALWATAMSAATVRIPIPFRMAFTSLSNNTYLAQAGSPPAFRKASSKSDIA